MTRSSYNIRHSKAMVFPGLTGAFAAFLNAKPSDRAELLEELTGTEIYGQISAMVYEQHKAARHA
ncbi:hypothetical protein J9B54_28235, partial [Klebsiella pneumoniae]